jgi:alanyl-tRNA synthetase
VTERLYYTDPYLTEFDSKVVAVRDVQGRTGVVLDRTAFYPTSGGQPYDTGTLGVARVVDVVDDGHEIVHVLEGDAPSGAVTGRIDWGRRFEHMQQHTGQHVLSAAIDRRCGARTQSFHLGTEAATIDLSRELSVAEIAAAEDAANDVVWADRPVTISFVEADAAAALPLRKESVRGGTLRIVDIDGYDLSACGGTHVARTGAIGVIVVSAWERFRGGTRLEFRCGGRALRAHRLLRDVAAEGAKLLSVGIAELPQAFERLQADARELRRRLKDADSRLAIFEAEALAARATQVGVVRVVAEALRDYDVNGLKTMAQAIVSKGRCAVVLVTAGSPVSLVIARAADVAIDVAPVLKELTAKFGGKGGGRPELAQGGGLLASPDEVVAAAKQLLSASIQGGS